MPIPSAHNVTHIEALYGEGSNIFYDEHGDFWGCSNPFTLWIMCFKGMGIVRSLKEAKRSRVTLAKLRGLPIRKYNALPLAAQAALY